LGQQGWGEGLINAGGGGGGGAPGALHVYSLNAEELLEMLLMVRWDSGQLQKF
jgi:hypothetical protein